MFAHAYLSKKLFSSFGTLLYVSEVHKYIVSVTIDSRVKGLETDHVR